jgi:hypothetical protein
MLEKFKTVIGFVSKVMEVASSIFISFVMGFEIAPFLVDDINSLVGTIIISSIFIISLNVFNIIFNISDIVNNIVKNIEEKSGE